jgi:hypothetical protein
MMVEAANASASVVQSLCEVVGSPGSAGWETVIEGSAKDETSGEVNVPATRLTRRAMGTLGIMFGNHSANAAAMLDPRQANELASPDERDAPEAVPESVAWRTRHP